MLMAFAVVGKKEKMKEKEGRSLKRKTSREKSRMR
jgi:hypothetical protein